VEGLGFAIPMNDVFSMVKDIMANYYKTTIIEQEGTLEQVIEDAILTEDKV